MALLRLVQENKLSLGDSVQKFFPSFPYIGITVKMLLSHRSGLPNYLYFMETEKKNKKYVTNNDVLDYLVTKKPNVSFTAGKRFNYCNTNFVLIALIIEKISGKTFPAFMQEQVFGPLQMKNTYVFTLADTAAATPTFKPNGGFWQNDLTDGTYGDKNIYSTPQDLLKWDQALYNNQLFTPETLEAAFKPYSNEKPGIKNYGFGWRMNIYPNGKKIIFHGGWWHGNNCILMRLIEDSATIIVLGNKYNRSIYQSKQLANIFQPYFGTEEEDQAENIKDDVLPSDTSSGQNEKFVCYFECFRNRLGRCHGFTGRGSKEEAASPTGLRVPGHGAWRDQRPLPGRRAGRSALQRTGLSRYRSRPAHPRLYAQRHRLALRRRTLSAV